MRKEDILTKKASFEGKYQETNPISVFLLNNFYKKLSEMIKSLEIESILELGCGLGYSTAIIREIRADVRMEASDVDMDLVEEARRRNASIKVEQDSIYSLNQPDNSYDLVIALEVLEHLDDPYKALEELKRVSRKYAIISVPNEPIWRILNLARGAYIKEWGNTPGHINHWSAKAIKKFISSNFDIINFKSPLPWNMVIAQKRNV